MRALVVYTSLAIACFVAGRYGRMPESHITYPEGAGADAKFYNYSGDGPEMVTSDIIFILGGSFGPCDKIGKVEIKETGDIGVCASTGWRVHQPDE